MNTQNPHPKSLTHTWKEQIRQVAVHNPRLARQLWQNRQVYFDRFAYFYRQLADLPRKFRRKFLKRLATTLAGAALLLALVQTLPAYAATITVDGVTCTLAEAIDSANNDNAAGNGCVDGNGADVIDLQTDVTLSALLPTITSEITLEGNGHTVDGNNAFRVLDVASTGDVTLNDATITGGFVSLIDKGGGIRNQGELTVNDSLLQSNSASYGGGGIANTGTLVVNNSTLSGNSASIGGGIENYNNATVTLNNSILSGNSAQFGGAIFNINGILTLNNSTLSGNSASIEGGGILNSYDSITLIVNNSMLSGNSAGSSGGGIDNGGTLTVNNSTLSGNTSTGPGGGGGINNGGTVTVNNSTLSDNSALSYSGLGNGGGIRNSNFGTVTVNNGTLSGNTANFGGGIGGGGTVTVNNSTLSGNSVTHHGGGINNGGTMTVNNSTFSDNSAGDDGGGIFNTATTNLNRSLISGNSANSSGAEVFVFSGVVNANNYNVVGYGGDARSSGFTPGPNDIIPPSALNTVLDTMLADNGGPTFTHALVSGSVAIDAAPNEPCLAPPINGVDQRGFPRNVDGDGSPSSNECDSGSFEYASSGVPTPTPMVTSTVTATATPTSTSLPGMTSTPRSSPTPTRTPVHPTETPNPRTPTRTPTPTQTPAPLVVNQENGLATSATDRSTNPLLNMVIVTLLALGNLLFFRKWRA